MISMKYSIRTKLHITFKNELNYRKKTSKNIRNKLHTNC